MKTSILKLAFAFLLSTTLARVGMTAEAKTTSKSAKSVSKKKSKETVKKIAVGPSPSPSPSPTPQIEPMVDTDSVDQPIPKAKIESSDAPGTAATPVATPVATPTAPDLVEPPSPAPTAEPEKNPVSAEQSLKWLLNGNTRFVTKTFRGDGRSAEDRMRSSTEQKPHAIVLACSESVSPPELIFDQGIGEITTIRVAGPQLDTSVIASLEQAVRNHESHLILVLGHTQCSSLEGSPYIGTKQLDPNSKHEVEAALNADGIARDLTSKSVFLKSRVDAKQLTIKSALYWVDTGKVKLY